MVKVIFLISTICRWFVRRFVSLLGFRKCFTSFDVSVFRVYFKNFCTHIFSEVKLKSLYNERMTKFTPVSV